VRSTAAPYTESRLAHLVRNKCLGFPVVEQILITKQVTKYALLTTLLAFSCMYCIVEILNSVLPLHVSRDRPFTFRQRLLASSYMYTVQCTYTYSLEGLYHCVHRVPGFLFNRPNWLPRPLSYKGVCPPPVPKVV
jgi:hypothetical protein